MKHKFKKEVHITVCIFLLIITIGLTLYIDYYKKIGYKVFINTDTNLKDIFKDKITVFVGQSGAGKSSLLNKLDSKLNLKTGEVSYALNRGKHTTTTSKYYIWDKNSSIIDTPGIRSLDVSSFSVKEIENYFKEFKNIDEKCKYKDCLHYKEKNIDCAIKRKVEEGLINKDRYESYIRIIDSLIK